VTRASTPAVALAIAKRSTRAAFTNPALLLPSIIFPLIFLLAFAGGLSSVGNVPGFDFPPGYTAFQFVFILMQSAAFGGFFGSIGVAADFESGFAKRLFLASSNRTGIVFGYALAGTARYAFNALLVTVAALIGGMRIDGSGIDMFGLYGLGFLVNALTGLFAIGVFMRTKSVQSAPALQTPVFLILFLAPVYVPLHLLDGWIHTIASVNPVTAIIQAGRGFIAGAPEHPGLAYAVAAGALALAVVFGVRSLRRAEAGL
jgi:ABC-2 type transport system permease protein